MKLEPLKSVKIKGVKIPKRIDVPEFADANKLSDRIFGAFCKINPELACMEDEVFIKNVFTCIKAAGGEDYLAKSRYCKLPAFVKEDPEIKRWRTYYENKKETEKAWKDENDQVLSDKKAKEKEAYGTVLVNGEKESLQSWAIEPEGIFFGRGDSPIKGLWKRGNTEEDVIINTDSEDPIDLIYEGDRGDYKVVEGYDWNRSWDPESHFAGSYTIQVGIPNPDGSMKTVKSTKYKMIAFSADSSVKKEGREKKFAAGSELGKYYKKVLDVLEKDFKTKSVKDLGTTIAVFFLFEKGIRIGSKSETVNGTKGLLSLEWGKDVKRSENKIKFDFYGKDSVRDISEIETEYADKIEKHWSKYGQLNTTKSEIKDYVTAIVPSLDGIFTPKLARTAVAAYTATNALEEMTKKFKVTKDSTTALKKLALDEATMMVARRLNHQKGVNKAAEEKRKAKFKETENSLKERETKAKDLAKTRKDKIKKLKKEKKEGWQEKVAKLEEMISNSEAKLEQAKLSLASKEKNQNFTAGTSKSAYIDPSILAEWCEKVDLPLEKVYSKTQMKQFANFFEK